MFIIKNISLLPSDGSILIVDDNQENRLYLSLLLEKNGFRFQVVPTGEEAVAKVLSENIMMVITDLMMPRMDGIELLTKIKQLNPEIEVLIVTAHGSIRTAIEAIKKGAFSYLLRPFEPEEAISTVKKIVELQQIRSENRRLKEELSFALKYDTIIGQNQSMVELLRTVNQVAQTHATILITGESGVGKELIARAIHEQSKNATGPFIKISCASLPEGLLESELFGYDKGAFTGAYQSKVGRFELATGGTLFLDEIGDISLQVQVKLLRAIQEREFERLGSNKTIKTTARFVAATNRDLLHEVKQKRFREDLFYRLNVILLKAPPLRDRKDDIPSLAYHFLNRYKKEINNEINSISDEALALLIEYDWPGNVRELQNVMERAVVIANDNVIGTELLPDNIKNLSESMAIDKQFAITSPTLPYRPLRAARADWEKDYLKEVLAFNQGNISKTARMLQIARNNLQKKIKQYRL
ncbi:MAG: sigma-54-dependent transcriptional regulator [Nitrospinota bacterium]